MSAYREGNSNYNSQISNIDIKVKTMIDDFDSDNESVIQS